MAFGSVLYVSAGRYSPRRQSEPQQQTENHLDRDLTQIKAGHGSMV
jgi:hypothetical protein